MNKILRHTILMFIVCWASVSSAQTTLYESDFSTFANGPLHQQDGWESQTDWQVSGGVVSNSGSWQRARLVHGFQMQPGEAVRMTIMFSLTGIPGNGNALAAVGLAKSNEHTGANTPQVGPEITWTDSTLAVGAASIANYSSGDMVAAEITFTMLAQADSWEVSTVLTNISNPANDQGVETDNDSAGAVTSETAWQWLSTGGTAYFGIRNLDNSSGATFGISEVLFEVDIPSMKGGSVTPNILGIQNGMVASGELGDVVESEDEYLEFFPTSPTASDDAPVDLSFSSFIPDSSISNLTLNLESSANTTGMLLIVDAYDWDLKQFDTVGVQKISPLSDSILQVDLSDAIGMYVRDGSGEVRIRGRWVQNSLAFFYPWTIRIDQLRLDYQ